MANLKQVAQHAGVSSATVSRYLNGSLQLPEATRQAVDAAIAALNYRPNPFARSLSRGRSDVIRMLIPDLRAPFFAALAAAVEDAAFAREQELVLSVTLNREGRERRYLENVTARHVDGLIFVTNTAQTDALRHQINTATRVVLLDEDVVGAKAPRIFCDNHGGGYLAGRHLAEQGHRVVAVVGPADAIHSARARFEGFAQAMTEIAGSHCRILRATGEFSFEDGRDLCAKLLDQNPDISAFFAISDDLVMGVLDELRRRNLRVPEDISIIGFDDILPLDHFSPPITAVSQPVGAMGAKAVEILLESDWDDPATHARIEILPVTLVKRASVAALSPRTP